MPDLEIIRARATAATPGPWTWTEHRFDGFDLVAAVSGIPYVMGFARRGFQGAQPTFAEGRDMASPGFSAGIMQHADDLRRSPGLQWPRTSVEFANPDARFIAHARKDVDDLLAEVDRLRIAAAEMRGHARTFAAALAGEVPAPEALEEARDAIAVRDAVRVGSPADAGGAP